MWVGFFWLIKENMIVPYAKVSLFTAKTLAAWIMNYSPDHSVVACGNKHTSFLTSNH